MNDSNTCINFIARKKNLFHQKFLNYQYADGYPNPWIEIDFGWTRFIDGVNVSLSKEAFRDLGNDLLEVRFGFEKNR
jgi:hypothetical protein